ncbi:MAG: CoA-binding protein [Proteobacteria bacterium]|nr:CoA-binding protein [Pseudomonadota bacterium]MBU4470970.1 CoA-binding protein [Pseudomonadota bacterium]MCG2751069.1 CoA-binding protein [Desulfobacteraceae bacterium]
MKTSVIDSLKSIFLPESIAVIGASNTPGKWGYSMISRPVESGYRGKIYPVNPGADKVYGIKAYSKISDLPEAVDLAIFTIPAVLVPGAVKECMDKGIKAGIVISAGFAEIGTKGEALQNELVEVARKGDFRFIGPNCMGVWSSSVRLNTAFHFKPEPGGITFLSQSGTMGGYLLETANNKGYGFHTFVSVGNQGDLSMADYLEYFGQDDLTKVIVLYIEGLKDSARFLKNAREVVKKKPIIVYKAGRTQDGARATMSHTASIAGSDTIFEAACKQAGIIRVYDVIHAFDLAEALSKQPLPKGKRVAIVSGGGGHCVVTTDACAIYGLEVPELDKKTVDEIQALLLPHAPIPKNPIDMAADNRPETIKKILEILAKHPDVDAIITATNFLRNLNDPEVLKLKTDITMMVSGIPKKYGKPLIATMHRSQMEGVLFDFMKAQGIPFYEFPEEASRAVYGLCRYAEIKKSFQQE